MMKKDARLIDNIRRTLDQSVEELDAQSCASLTQARHRALEALPQKKSRLLVWGSIPAAAMLLLLLVLNWPTATLQPAAPELTDLGILTTAEPLEFYQEDLEFYEWLSEVLEKEKELSEHAAPRLAPVADNRIGTGTSRSAIAESGTARLSGVI